MNTGSSDTWSPSHSLHKYEAYNSRDYPLPSNPSGTKTDGQQGDAGDEERRRIGGFGLLPAPVLSIHPRLPSSPSPLAATSSATLFSSGDDSVLELHTPRDDSSIHVPSRTSAASPIGNSSPEDDPKRTSVFTVSAYLLNSPAPEQHGFEPAGSMMLEPDQGVPDAASGRIPVSDTSLPTGLQQPAAHDAVHAVASCQSDLMRGQETSTSQSSMFSDALPSQSTEATLIASSTVSEMETISSWGNLGPLPSTRAQSPFETTPSFGTIASPSTNSSSPSYGTDRSQAVAASSRARKVSNAAERPSSPTQSIASTVTHDEEHGYIVAPSIHAGASGATVPHLDEDFVADGARHARTRSASSGLPQTPPTTSRAAFRYTTQSIPSSISFDSPSISDGSPGIPTPVITPDVGGRTAGMNFVLTGSPERDPPPTEDQPQRQESGRGLGIAGVSRQPEWLSRYAGAFGARATGGEHVATRREVTAGSTEVWAPKEEEEVLTSPRRAHIARPVPSPTSPSPIHARARPQTATTDSRPVHLDHRTIRERAQLPARPRTANTDSMLGFNSFSRKVRPSRTPDRDRNEGFFGGSSSSLLPLDSSAPPTPCESVKRVSASSAGSSTLAGTEETAMDIRLPRELLFLTTSCIELWIDQEGFRAIRPAFWLVTATSHYAEFRPRGESFVFHHATLDSAPVLRRLTVNNDERLDYLSRQASLVLKTSGTYVVDGAEDRNRLSWKLKYRVQDRLDVVGRPMAGEKILTPISFTCTPQLLDPAAGRGKKVRLLHVMKKTMTPNLVATKLPEDVADASRTLGQHATSHDGRNETIFNGRPRAATLSFGQVASAVQQLPSRVIPSSIRPSTADNARPRRGTSESMRPNTSSGASDHWPARPQSRRPGTSAGPSSSHDS